MNGNQLVTQALQRTNAHGLARLVNEKRVYTRVLWLLAWLVCCGLFIRQLVGFIGRLQANDVTTNYRADEVPFEYPDLFLCFDNPMSGSRHLEVNQEFIALVNRTLQDADAAMVRWCDVLSEPACESMKSRAAEIVINSLPYREVADKIGHVKEQSVLFATLIKTNGLTFKTLSLQVHAFYHPKHLRCFRLALDATQREMMKYTGPDDSLVISAMLDPPDARMGQQLLPNISTDSGNLTTPYWAFDTANLLSKVRSSNLRVFLTPPSHYPSYSDENLALEGGRVYSIELEMKEQVHTDDPTKCIDKSALVQVVNPYDNSAYEVAYDYSYCYMSAMQAQFRHLLNASLGYLPQPWPPTERLLYNLSSGWGSNISDILAYLEVGSALSLEEPFKLCANLRPCTEHSYKWEMQSNVLPIDDMIDVLTVSELALKPSAVMDYIRRMKASENDSRLLDEYFKANFLQFEIYVKKPMADRIIFARAYSFESFVADVGGILGIYLGMSVLTACEVIQFLFDLGMFYWTMYFSKIKKNGLTNRSPAESDQRAIFFINLDPAAASRL